VFIYVDISVVDPKLFFISETSSGSDPKNSPFHNATDFKKHFHGILKHRYFSKNVQFRIWIHNLEFSFQIVQKVTDPCGSGSTTLTRYRYRMSY
jgi:hypothetical protein